MDRFIPLTYQDVVRMEPSSIMLNHNRNTCFTRKMSVAGYDIVPMGDNNDIGRRMAGLLDRFYAGEGILGKIAGLQWGGRSPVL